MTANSTASIYRGLKSCEAWSSTASSINTLSVEVYEIQFFRVVFHPIHEYMFRSSFLITLNIYKDYFKCRQGLHKLHKCRAKVLFMQIVTGDKICPSSSFSWRSYYVLYTVGFCDQRASWSLSCDELKNFVVNILLKLVIKLRTRIHASIC